MRGEVAIVASALMMSTVSIFVRHIEGDAVSVTFLRFFSALIFVAFFSLITEQYRFKINRVLMAFALANVVTVVCYISAIQGVEVATAALLLYMAPVYVLPIAALRGERIEPKTWVAVPLGIGGLYLMLSPYAELTPALVLGVASGVAYAFVFILSKEARKKYTPVQISLFNLAFGSLVLLPHFFVKGADYSLEWVVGLGLIPTAAPFLLFTYGIKYVKVQRAPILALVEPLSASLIGFLYFGEVLTLKQVVGAALILVSVSLAWRE